jgi:hypothetical protein
VAVQGDPFGWTFGEWNFFCGIATKVETRDERMFEAGAERNVCAVKVAARIVFFKGRGADDDAVDFHGSAGGRAGDGEFFREDTSGKKQNGRAEGKRVEAHGNDPTGIYYRRSYSKWKL